jgi:hypothetical protein
VRTAREAVAVQASALYTIDGANVPRVAQTPFVRLCIHALACTREERRGVPRVPRVLCEMETRIGSSIHGSHHVHCAKSRRLDAKCHTGPARHILLRSPSRQGVPVLHHARPHSKAVTGPVPDLNPFRARGT